VSRLREFFLGPPRDDEVAFRDVEPLEGTRMSLWNSQIPNFWSDTFGTSRWYAAPDLADRVWVANRCIQLNAQQIASMPLTFNPGSPVEPADGAFAIAAPRTTRPPAWLSNPDPSWYPNGVSDAVFAIVRSIYGWGYALLYVTSYYADGFPQFWTVLDTSLVTVKIENGRRVYSFGDNLIDASRIIQIDRDPSSLAHGTPALRAYAQQAYSALAAADQSLTVSAGGMPKFYLKDTKGLKEEQALAIQSQWAERTAARGGLPPVVPPEIDPTELSFNPSDLALLESQEFNARVIASAFGVPAVLLNIPMAGGLTYQNPAALGEMWWRFELRPMSKRIADALSAQALPRGQWVNFEAEDTFAALGPDSEVDDPQLADSAPTTAQATPAQQPGRLTAIGG